MSIGDSALDYFSKEKIEDHSKHEWFKSNKFTPVSNLSLSSFKTYELIQISFKTNDKKLALQTIEGIIFYDNNIKKCEEKLDEIVDELSKMFVNTKKKNKKKFKHNGDKSGKSKVIDAQFIFSSGDKVMIGCVDWSEELTKKNNWTDHLRITVRTKDYSYFLANKAY
jgi:bisphosphoglycerate-dependent phosphoglycerate mutase